MLMISSKMPPICSLLPFPTLEINTRGRMQAPFLLFFLCIHGFLVVIPALDDGVTDPHNFLQFDLLRHWPTGDGSLVELVQSDRLRQRSISGVIGQHRRHRAWERPVANEPSFGMPIKSAAYTGAGQYFVRFRVGTPAQKFLLVADTGSDLTWMKCKYGHAGTEAVPLRGRVFDAGKSRTFRPIPCSSGMCKTSLPFSLTTCPSSTSPCAYDYGYSDGSTAQGFYANESATVKLAGGRKTKLPGLVVGCTYASSGRTLRAADGVLGLGYSAISFATHATAAYGGRFSYCLVDHLSPRNVSSRLTFGRDPRVVKSWVRETPLLIEPRLEPFYAVGVEGISVGGEVLRIPMSVWDVGRGGGAILDSGTSLTVLAEPAYREVVAAIGRRLEAVPRVRQEPFEYCYNWTAATPPPEMPRLMVHFVGAARLVPPAKSYVIDVADGVKCIGLTSTPWPGVSTIGNIMQQEHLWEFDVSNRRLRFHRSSCRPRR